MKKKCPKPGIYPDMSFEDYFNANAVNASLLKKIDAKTPMHAHDDYVQPYAPTPAMVKGQGIHTLMLEPGWFDERYVKGLTDDDGKRLPRRSNDQKAQHEAHTQRNKGKDVLEPDDYDAMFVWRDRIMANPDCARLLGNALRFEFSYFWEDKETGLMMKARGDILTTDDGYTVCADLKMTKDASFWGFSRELSKYGYDQQGAHYLDGLNALAPQQRLFKFLCIENERPYPAAVWTLGEKSIDAGRIRNRNALNRWKTAIDNDEYPAYRLGGDVIEAQDWRLNATEDEI